MSDVVERVAATLRKHVNTTRGKPGKRPGYIANVTACKGCDWEADTIDYAAHEAHVAAAVVAALGLKKGYDPARDCLVVSYVELSEQGSSE